MSEATDSVYWEAPEHRHIEKTSDWFWVLGIIAISTAVASIIFNNVLFAVVILLAATTMFLSAHRKPRDIEFEVSTRGVRIDNTMHPYATLDSYYLDEENLVNPQLILKAQKLFVPLMIIPVPDDHINEIEDIIGTRLPEEYLEEPMSHKILEFFGF